MRLEKQYKIIIVGAGLAGIASALRLHKKGHRVLVVEKNSHVGGKISEFSSNGFRWDQGPSLLTEPENILELFEIYNRNPNDYFEFVRHKESCRYFFNDHSNLTLSSDLEQSKEEIQKVISRESANHYEDYISNSKKDYHSIGSLFLNEPIPTFFDYFKPNLIKHYPFFLSRKMFQSLHKYNRSQFKSEKLNLIFNRFGTYNGSNPYQMSGLYSMIPSLELTDGTYFPKKGMRSIIDALYKLACEENIEFHFNTELQIKKEAAGYSYTSNTDFSGICDKVVCAMDHITFYDKVFRNNILSSKFKKEERSSSGLVFYWGINTTIKQLGLHNIIFSDDYKKEFDLLFKEKKNSLNPSIYIHISSILNPGDAPSTGQNLFIMINTSSYENVDESYRAEIKLYIIKKIKEHFKIDIQEHIITEEYWDNSKIESITGAYLGALYGASSNALSSANKRHPNVSKFYDGLYFCGGTAHPGGGIPLVLKSAKIVANCIT